jgi:hypothetical protein
MMNWEGFGRSICAPFKTQLYYVLGGTEENCGIRVAGFWQTPCDYKSKALPLHLPARYIYHRNLVKTANLQFLSACD